MVSLSIKNNSNLQILMPSPLTGRRRPTSSSRRICILSSFLPDKEYDNKFVPFSLSQWKMATQHDVFHWMHNHLYICKQLILNNNLSCFNYRGIWTRLYVFAQMKERNWDMIASIVSVAAFTGTQGCNNSFFFDAVFIKRWQKLYLKKHTFFFFFCQ